MIDPTTLYLFIFTNILLALAPGPDNIYVLTQGITRGKKAAFVTTLGFTSGVMVHTLAAALGLSVIFQTSQLAFDIVKYIGAIYLLYLAYQAFKHRHTPLDLDGSNSSKQLKQLYFRGLIMNLVNPKVSIFFLALLPQFVNPENGSITIQMILLGVSAMFTTIIVFSIIGIMGSKLSSKLKTNPTISSYLNTLTSFVLFSLGIKLALAQR
jgi:threonine/homoserine/homoserine lactone efflux protein